MIDTLPTEALVVLGLLSAAMVLSCLQVMGSELEHALKVHNLRVQARTLHNHRYRHAMELKRQADEARRSHRAKQEARRAERARLRNEIDDNDADQPQTMAAAA